MRIYGHRGARGEMPENTIAGFRHAKAAGVAGIETDIALTADLVPVLHHEPNLPDGRLIRDVSRAVIPAVPSLAEALSAVPDLEWLLEIKTYPDARGRSHPPETVVPAVLKLLQTTNTPTARVRILAFDWAVLRLFAALAPQLRRVCLTEPGKPAPLWWGPRHAGCSPPAAAAQSGATAWAPRHDTLTPALAREARQLNLEIFTWTVNDPAELHYFAGLADAIITDVPTVVGGQWPVARKNTGN